MPGFCCGLGDFLYNWIFPPAPPLPPVPAPGTVFGYQWHPGAGVPAAIQQLVFAALGGGVFVAFTGDQLDGGIDPFGRAGAAPGPVFAANAPAALAVTNMVNQVAQNPPPGQGGWANPAPGRVADLGGYLAYTANCLDLLDHTLDGHTLLTRIAATGRNVLILPARAGNQTFAGHQDSAIDVLTVAVRNYAAGGAVPGALIRAAVAAQYGHIVGDPARYAQLATDMNNAPLYTLFETAAAAPATYLLNNFAYNALPLAGPDLEAWASAAGDPLFDAAVRGMTVPNADGVAMREAFLLALCVALRPAIAPGLGTNPSINFYTQHVDDNVPGALDFRPPAIGLAHELMHAMHYTAGTAAGYEFGHFTTTAAELMFTGIGPAATDPITENAIRLQWPPNGIAVDASNVWGPPGPGPRLVYDAPPVGATAAQLRAHYRCL